MNLPDSFENPGNVPTSKKKGIKIPETILQALPLFKTVLQIHKLLGLNGQEGIHLT
jgi:hypothetical protein